jgi:hypothetical protein
MYQQVYVWLLLIIIKKIFLNFMWVLNNPEINMGSSIPNQIPKNKKHVLNRYRYK